MDNGRRPIGPERRIVVAFGTRPEAIKLAPVVAELDRSPGLRPVVVVSGQHREMLDDVLRVFSILPDHDLAVMTTRQTLEWVTTQVLNGLGPILEAERPDAVLVQGDTTTTFAAALAAFYRQIPVIHLEAGLRSGGRYAPFPEEINRKLTTQLADLHLAPTKLNRANLLAEGVPSERIVVTGNTVVDALMMAVDRHERFDDPRLEALDSDPRQVILATAHRRESWGEGMVRISAALAEIARRHPEMLVVFPMHRNPVVRDLVRSQLEGLRNVLLVEPLPYGQFSRLMSRAHLILTDSGGIQEEAPSLDTPVLVIRETTERPEVLREGAARLVGTDTASIVADVDELLGNEAEYELMANARNPYGDGEAARRSVAAIAYFLRAGARPDEFEDYAIAAPVQRTPATVGGLGQLHAVVKRQATGTLPYAWESRWKP